MGVAGVDAESQTCLEVAEMVQEDKAIADRYSISLQFNPDGGMQLFGISRYGSAQVGSRAKVISNLEPDKQFTDLVQEIIALGFCSCRIEIQSYDGRITLSCLRQDGSPIAVELTGSEITNFLVCGSRAKRRLKDRDNREFDGILHHSFDDEYPEQPRYWRDTQAQKVTA